MAEITKKTRFVYNLELDEDEMRVVANVMYRVQHNMYGNGKITSNINREIEKHCYVDEFDPEGRENWIEMISPPDLPGLYWA